LIALKKESLSNMNISLIVFIILPIIIGLIGTLVIKLISKSK